MRRYINITWPEDSVAGLHSTLHRYMHKYSNILYCFSLCNNAVRNGKYQLEQLNQTLYMRVSLFEIPQQNISQYRVQGHFYFLFAFAKQAYQMHLWLLNTTTLCQLKRLNTFFVWISELHKSRITRKCHYILFGKLHDRHDVLIIKKTARLFLYKKRQNNAISVSHYK